MDIFVHIALLAILCYLLVRSADLVEETFVVLAHKLRINTFIIGFVVLGIATSLPEISVAVSSSIEKVSELSIGNILGADILLLTLVIGLNAIRHKKVPFAGSFGREQVFAVLILIALSVTTIMDQNLTFTEGILLLVAYTGYVIYLTNHINHANFHEHAKIKVVKIFHLLGRSALGVFGLIICAKLIVDVAVTLSGPEMLNIPEAIVGILIIALGTNIPELAILFRSTGLEEEKMATGNFLGSACVNVAIFGLIGVLSPQNIQGFSSILPVIAILLFTLLLFGFFAWTDKKITRREGFLLVAIYIFMVITQGLIITQIRSGELIAGLG